MGGCGREAVDAKTDRHLVLSVQLHEDYLFGLSCKLMRAIVIGPYTDVETGTEGFRPETPAAHHSSPPCHGLAEVISNKLAQASEYLSQRIKRLPSPFFEVKLICGC